MKKTVLERRNSLPDNFFQRGTRKTELSTTIRPCSPVSELDTLAEKINHNMQKQKDISDKLKLWQEKISSTSLVSIPEEQENTDGMTF